MPIQYKLSFASRLAQHVHILWTSDQYADADISIPKLKESHVLNMPASSFNQGMAPLKYGRFYPSRILNVIDSPASLFRVTEIEDNAFTADFNHPLAGKETNLEKNSVDIEYLPVGKPEMILEWGGIDAPLHEKDTDYSIPDAFDRKDSYDDAVFYEQPRKVIHIDQTCLSRITAFYSDLLNPDDAVLDLMSSWRSHLPDQLHKVSGVGMNAIEMNDNYQLNSYVVHDLNRNPTLPFDDRNFHSVVNTVSIEYLTDPHKVFSEVRRVLNPGGLVIVTFSNRYFPPKTTTFWPLLHPAERPGWVLQLLHTSGFSDLHCHVERGLIRSDDDRYAGQVEEMDPLFAVWGRS
jgi:hypothetical protein